MESLAKNDFTPAQAFYGYAILQGEYGFKKDEKLGLKWLRLAEERECPVAYTYLYYAYQDGTGVKENKKKAEKYLEAALAKGGIIPEALLAKGYEYFNSGDEEKAKACFTKANEINKNYGKEELCEIIMSKELLPMEAEMVLSMLKKAVTTNKVLRLTAYAYEWGNNIQKASRYLLAAAHQGDKSAKKILADYYMYGLLPTDYKKAEEYLLPLANEGDAQAYIKLGRLYSTFKDFYDEEKAEKYLVLAAESGEAEYMYSLGSFYQSVKYDYKKAKSSYKQAAELGYAKAQAKYGERLWLDGKDKQALEWIEKGAAQGDKDALFMLGKFHDEHKDDKKAFAAYMQAAEKGCEISQYRVGDAYLRGKGVAQNDKKGVAWILKAGENGHFEAYAMLSVLYEQGVGVPKDLVKAEYWKAKLDEFLSNT
jgi:TPR repeat protein